MTLVDTLRSISEPTRLRVLALLAHGELSVGELVDILSMSQPRLSRHLKFLTAAGLVERLPEGAWVFYRLPAAGETRALTDAILSFVGADEPEIQRDLQNLKRVRNKRRASAETYFNEIAGDWDDMRSHNYPASDVETALLELTPSAPLPLIIDLGTGTGRMLSLFQDRASRLEGIDSSHNMLNIARANLEQSGIKHASVRHGDVTALPFEDDAADLVIMHQVLHYIDQPERVISEGERVLKPEGRLIIVDFETHGVEALRKDQQHRHLGFADEDVAAWMAKLSLTPRAPLSFPSKTERAPIVKIWVADKPSLGAKS